MKIYKIRFLCTAADNEAAECVFVLKELKFAISSSKRSFIQCNCQHFIDLCFSEREEVHLLIILCEEIKSMQPSCPIGEEIYMKQ